MLQVYYNYLLKIYSASSCKTFEVEHNDYSFMAEALLHALDCPGGKKILGDLYGHIVEC